MVGDNVVGGASRPLFMSDRPVSFKKPTSNAAPKLNGCGPIFVCSGPLVLFRRDFSFYPRFSGGVGISQDLL